MPVYTKGEELFNAISHIVGGGLGILFAAIAFIVAAQTPTAEKIVAVSIYSLSIVTLYTMSSLYHFLPMGKAKRIFRIFDHCTIYLLIAGCYTPFCMILFWNEPIGKIIFFTEWGIALLGITFNAINMNWKAVKVLSMISYVIMGWMIVLVFPSLLQRVAFACVAFLLAGGISYTVGILFYALGKKKKYMHCVWHMFVLAGSILQFISILMLL
jgi:hemolysin III